MPVSTNGEVTLSMRKGLLCWLCIMLYWVAWGLLASVTNEWVVLGGGTFGVIPMLFFAHEEKKCKHERRKCM